MQTIDGSNAPGLTLSGGNSTRLFNSSAPLTLIGFILSEGHGRGGGGAIAASDSLTLMQMTIVNNSATGYSEGARSGGGILISGELTLVDCTIRNNTAGEGGGVHVTGVATIINSTISANHADRGGGLLINGTMTIQNSTIIENQSIKLQGGGLYVGFGTVQLENTILENNLGHNCKRSALATVVERWEEERVVDVTCDAR